MGKHIAFYLPNLDGGGAERMMVTLANEFERRGFRVDFVLVQADGINLKLLSKTIHLVDLKSANTIASLPKLIGYMTKVRPEIFLSSLDLTNLIALLARRLSGVDMRLIVRVESTVSAQKRSFWKKKLEKILLSFIYPWADAVIAVSKYVADDVKIYARLASSKVHVVYNPVITPELLEKSKEDVNHPWFRPGSLPVVLGVGRLAEPKDFDVLIKSFAIVRSRMQARLVILGEGELRHELETLVCRLGLEKDVDLPGYVENPFAFIRRAGVFVLSSRWEGLPTVLIEALACGCPVVSTDCPGGSREILRDGVYGDLTPVGDSEAMAATICSVLSKSGRQVDPEWLAQFSLSNTVSQTIELLDLLRANRV